MPSESPTVGEILREQAHSRGDHPLLVCDAERISYADADRRSAQLARERLGLDSSATLAVMPHSWGGPRKEVLERTAIGCPPEKPQGDRFPRLPCCWLGLCVRLWCPPKRLGSRGRETHFPEIDFIRRKLKCYVRVPISRGLCRYNSAFCILTTVGVG